ncbi:FolC bifunctional protein [Coniochaeta ligniaria NRRL 30616]|uniref:Folylpolyglutamate synthase n=1 Tax=Coniochaeta ligniaria NRRL 30616 TaxID=1408157 RepID=A0A1J7J2A9_9PEZI|nr:FolC bifunctional protein [Coniochaeta ligniaria NRRL 30616]
MATKSRTYNDAIDALNSLQTPYAIIEARRKAGIKPDETSIREMRDYLSRIGYSPTDLDRLNILHVAGTKGKGSTCAFASSILSRYQASHSVPRKIGLFTSPHLIAVRERIRINSAPISEALFARYFFEVWDRLSSTPVSRELVELSRGDELRATPQKPIYARYLTLMSYHVFLSEGVDVAVYETGIGGEFDATNVVERPVATGITTLGIDHVFVLGKTVGEIAWHKAGIMKRGSAAYTVEQVPEAMEVLQRRAKEKGVELKVVRVDGRLEGVRVRPDAEFQKRNASLGVVLAEEALGRLDPGFVRGGERLSREFVQGVEEVVWRGRCEVLEEGRTRWHVDGAHTVDSLRLAGRWFADECKGRTGPRALIFNQQGRTEAVDFLEGLFNGSKSADGRSFDHVVFCTNVTYAETGYKRDFVNHQYDPKAIEKLTQQHMFAEKWRALDPPAKITVLPSIEGAINHVRELTKDLDEKDTVQAFITGSLHLVGGALGILEGADAL